MRVITRAQWRAKPPLRRPLPTNLPWPRMWLHHTAGQRGGDKVVRDVQKMHQAKGWRDIAYNFMVGDDDVFEGMGLYRHLNADASGSGTICWMGDFHANPVPDSFIDQTAWLLVHGWVSGWWQHPRLDGGHRDLKATACPGDYAYAAIPAINARAWDLIYPPTEPPSEEDDMKRWIVRAPTGAVYVFDGETLRVADDATYRGILRFHGAMAPDPAADTWFDWTQKQIDAVPVVAS